MRVDPLDRGFSLQMPEVGAVVTCRVTAINPRFAKVDILCLGAQPLKDTLHGMIRCGLSQQHEEGNKQPTPTGPSCG